MSRLRTLILAYKFMYDGICTPNVILCVSIKFSFVKPSVFALVCIVSFFSILLEEEYGRILWIYNIAKCSFVFSF